MIVLGCWGSFIRYESTSGVGVLVEVALTVAVGIDSTNARSFLLNT